MATGERTVRVTRSLPRSVRATEPPLVLRSGEPVTVRERSDEWPAFLLVRTSRGGVGWVPERHLGPERPRTRVRRGYDTSSLDPAVGETLTVLATDRASGWAWCRDADGRLGWFPVEFTDDL
jgi:SH3-like domain-containing protein